MNKVIENLDVYPEQMERNIEFTHGLFASQRILTQLVEKGMQREEAYALIQKGAFQAVQSAQSLQQILQNEPAISSKISASELAECFDIQWYLRHVDHIYRRVGLLS